MKTVFFGTGAFGIPSLKIIKGELSKQAELLLVVTSPDAPKGRGLELSRSPVKTWALSHGVPVLDYDPRSRSVLEGIKKLDADIFVVIDFGFILPKELIEAPKRMAINLHASLLPRYRGPAPIQWSLINGDTKTGISVIKMVEKLDAGDILAQSTLMIDPEDDLESLSKRLSAFGAPTLMKCIVQLNVESIKLYPQDESQVTFARKITKEDGRIDWRLSADDVRNRFRAFKTWPTAYCYYRGKRLIVRELSQASGDFLKVLKTKTHGKPKPGAILWAPDYLGAILVMTQDLPVRILNIQAEGRKALDAGEFLKGFPLKEGDVLE